MMNVGERIARLRAIYGVSQYLLSKRSGIAQGALSQYEAGKKTPGVDTLERICEGLGITLTSFFAQDPDDELHWEQLTQRERQLLGVYRQLDEAHQKDMHLIMEALLRAGAEEEGGASVPDES